MPSCFRSACRLHLRPDFRARLAMVAHPLVVVPVESFVAPVHALKFFIGQPAVGSNARDHEVVAAEDFCHLVDHIGVQAADRGAHRHHRSHADDDPDQGQKSPQFVGKNRLHGNLQGVGVKGKKAFIE